MFRTTYGPSSGSHNLFLTEVTGFVSVLAYFCVRRQCSTALTDTIDTHTKGQDMQPNTRGWTTEDSGLYSWQGLSV
jgi:hypothetical protein